LYRALLNGAALLPFDLDSTGLSVGELASRREDYGMPFTRGGF
jgi:hypothetical protein